MKRRLSIIIQTLLCIAIIWLVVTGSAWQANNPLANEMTFWTHFGDAVCFRSLPQFQASSDGD